MERPKFSVLIPSYNRPKYVRLAAESVLASRFKDFELVISDDCSPRQREIKEALHPLSVDRRVRLILQRENLREAGNRDFLFRAAKGEWHIVLCDDDLLLPNCLERLATVIEKVPGSDLFAFGYSVIDEKGFVKFSRHAPMPFEIHLEAGLVHRRFWLTDEFPFWMYHPATFCCHRSVRQRIEPNRSVGIGDDIMFLFDYVNSGGRIYVLPEPLFGYRKFATSDREPQINQSADELAEIVARYRIMHQLEDRRDLDPRVKAFVQSSRFRWGFFFRNAIVRGVDRRSLEKMTDVLPAHGSEWEQLRRKKARRVTEALAYLLRSWYFLRLFGPRALWEIGRVACERVRLRVSGPRRRLLNR